MNRIKSLRKAANMTQVELAQKLGVSQGNLSAWETGRWNPEMDTVQKMCELFDCSMDFLLGQSIRPITESERSVNNIYFHLAKEMEDMQLPEEDIEKILDFARYIKSKNEQKN